MANKRWNRSLSTLSPQQQVTWANEEAEHHARIPEHRRGRTKAEFTVEELAALQAKLERWLATARKRGTR